MEKVSEIVLPHQGLHTLDPHEASFNKDNDAQQSLTTVQPPEHLLIKTKDGKTISPPVEALLLLLLIDKTNYIETEGRKIANDVESTCKKMKLLDTLYKDILEMSEKNGSLDWKKKGLGPAIETARKEGFVLPAKDGVLAREERDALQPSRDQISCLSRFQAKYHPR